jgi:hypothetical protein
MATYISELFPIAGEVPDWDCVEFDREIDRNLGERLSWRFARQLTDAIVLWHDRKFWVFAPTPVDLAAYRSSWAEIATEISDRQFNPPSPVERPQRIPDRILSELAVAILKLDRTIVPLSPSFDLRGIKVYRQGEYRSINSLLNISIVTRLILVTNIPKFHHDYYPDLDLESFLNNSLQVRPIDSLNVGKIDRIVGRLSQHRSHLLKSATSIKLEAAIKAATDDELVVSIYHDRDRQESYHCLSTLCPWVNYPTVDRLGIDYAQLLQLTHISYADRLALNATTKQIVTHRLQKYHLTIGTSINSKNRSTDFHRYLQTIEDTEILFGQEVRGIYGQTILGLKQGGVYRRHPQFADGERQIRISTLRLGIEPIDISIAVKAIAELANYQFPAFEVMRKAVNIEHINTPENRHQLELAIAELLTATTDLVLIILPAKEPEEREESLANFINYRISRAGKVCQTIDRDTILKYKGRSSSLLNILVPGILAKLGNLPYILAEPIDLTDYIVGIGQSIASKIDEQGVRYGCTAARIYDRYGEFCSCEFVAHSMTEPELSIDLLEKFLPAKMMGGKRILIYLTGELSDRKVENIRAWGKAIAAELTIVEYHRDRVPNLYELSAIKDAEHQWVHQISPPTMGLWYKQSDYEAILVTNHLPNITGVPSLVKLKILDTPQPTIDLERTIAATLKLTLLHHGAIDLPRDPIPIVGMEKIADRVLYGLAPTMLDRDRQWWL